MPELPEVETVSLALSKVVTNAKILKTEILRNDLRWNIKKSMKKDLHNDFFKKPFRRGKYILVPTNKDNICAEKTSSKVAGNLSIIKYNTGTL